MAYKRPRAASPSASQKRSRRAGGSSSQYVKLGTELPPEEDGDEASFVPIWKQTVTDEQGRRRLHGAFTGGFSAGYFNSVGSKEGWAPKAFVSSRSNRTKDQPNAGSQRPEDFMDEEDMAEAAESRTLETTQSFAAVGGSGVSDTKDNLLGLFATEGDTMGVKIIQKMGWRRGKGIGRKVRRPALLGDHVGASSSKDIAAQHLFAPKDVSSVSMASQATRKGLGFQSEARLSKTEEDTEAKAPFALPFMGRKVKAQGPKKPAAKKSSFGVGVLNDTGSDDEDPYELGPKITFNRTIGKDKKTKKPSKFARPGLADKPILVPKKGVSSSTSSIPRISHDGTTPLRGFVLALQVSSQPTGSKFPPPKIPPGWTSSKGAVSETIPSFRSVADAAKSSTLDAKARASLLGETTLPGKSVFDFISKESRDKIAALTGKTNLPQGLGQSVPTSDRHGQKDLWSFVPRLDKHIAAATLAKGATGWMPYAEDLDKRARYVGFLELRAGTKEDLPERAPGLSVSGWVKELEEFAHAAQVFKPTSSIMASRFTSSTSSILPSAGNGSNGTNLLLVPAAKPEDPAEQAAKLGMYGPMTRSQLPFHPSRLLCKRFNVASLVDEHTKPREFVSKTAMAEMMHEVSTNGPALQRPAWMYQQQVPVPKPAAEHATVDVETNEALSKDRAPEEVFKAIFGDDDDEE